MSVSFRNGLTLAALGAALALFGCQRTPDGSLEVASATQVSEFLHLTPASVPAEPDDRVAMAGFPPAPVGEEWQLSRRADELDAWKPVAAAPASLGVPVAAAANGLSCRNETGGSERVRVVCD